MPKQLFYSSLGKKFNNPNAMYVELTFDSTSTFTHIII